MSDKPILAKNVNFVNGVTALGSKLSLQASKSNTLEVTPLGLKATSQSSGRVILVPFTNISGMELYPEPRQEPAKQSAPVKSVSMMAVPAETKPETN